MQVQTIADPEPACRVAAVCSRLAIRARPTTNAAQTFAPVVLARLQQVSIVSYGVTLARSNRARQTGLAASIPIVKMVSVSSLHVAKEDFQVAHASTEDASTEAVQTANAQNRPLALTAAQLLNVLS